MPKIQESVVINASANTVHALLTQPAQIVKWYDGIDSVDPGANYPNVGSTIEGAMKVMGIEIRAQQTVLEHQPGALLRYSLAGMVTGTQEWRITDAGGGKVKLEMTTDFSMSNPLGKLAEPAVFSMLSGSAKKSLENIKTMAEGS